ncbi:hypothetical protein Acy02nite_85020 [Actinoplanes cyaneus]|uniref:HTH luxR-type domain-containing protein n=1 Tax=Actinoplanes cyaneus TaxID=52696 RepID=A0A919ISU5_9ACTN|nr:LuxR C-terminal-related transcriptional regulator [Actinoplanes cyaneus]MCW2143878.1 putative ATPase [Actinoplanes cyaneus]GID70621.1 hypothetical protein Acy02nite_85020 [Actinoplanes cyaneus]
MTTADVSAREGEVLTLLGQHLSNAEIAAKLFISVRTVESHVSALLRKLDVPDRRALASIKGSAPVRPVLPVPLTSFVGRAAEIAELTAVLKAHRQVTAVGPGGVGKTRLALAVAAELGRDYPDGVWFVDLVPVSGPGACVVAAAVAATMGLGEQLGRAMDESVVDALADRTVLLVLDNCEQVRDGVAPFLEKLLTTCPEVTVLATSRARLLVPFERVFTVPPLSLDGGGDSDAVALFLDRAAAASWPPNHALRDPIAAFCRRLDGMALAIELAAARWPALGLDGLTAGLDDPLRMLEGGSRTDERHRSVRAALDWSHALLSPADQGLLRRLAVFVSPFTLPAAAEVAGATADGLARLAEQSLLTVTPSPGGTEFRLLETIRQYGLEQLTVAAELDGVRAAHLRWCRARATELVDADPDWRVSFDAIADDLRAAQAWASDFDLTRRLAELTFARRLAAESQIRFEQAAGLAPDPAVAAEMYRQAAAVAGCRIRGDDLYRYLRAAAAAAPSESAAARDLALAATSTHRFWGKFERLPAREETLRLVDEARKLAGNSPAALAAVALAEAGVLSDAFGAAQGPAGNTVPETLARAQRAVDLAGDLGDPLAESAALDALIGAQSWAGDTFATAATARRRLLLLAPLPDTPAVLHERLDALGMAVETALGAGDLLAARRAGRELAGHPMLAEVGHRATCWLLVTEALAGNLDEVSRLGERFLESWQRAGRPPASALSPAAAAVAMVHGLRGDEDSRARWQAVVERMGVTAELTYGFGAVFDTILLLDQGRVAQAAERTVPEPDEVWKWVTWIWLHWYVALRAEAAVLAESAEAASRVAAAREVVEGNPVAAALVERAGALLVSDRDRVLATAETLDAAGCAYQAARSRLLAR